jgi:hypothetical protein
MPNEVVTLQQAVRDKRYAKETFSHVGARYILLGKIHKMLSIYSQSVPV